MYLFKMVGFLYNKVGFFFTQRQLNIQWDKIVVEIRTQRELKEFEQEDRIRQEEAGKAGEDGSDKEVIQQCVKKKKKGPSPPAVCETKEVWEDYPEFNPLAFHPDNDLLHYVRGSDLLYNEPWWKMNSVSLYVLHEYGFGGFGMLCFTPSARARISIGRACIPVSRA